MGAGSVSTFEIGPVFWLCYLSYLTSYLLLIIGLYPSFGKSILFSGEKLPSSYDTSSAQKMKKTKLAVLRK